MPRFCPLLSVSPRERERVEHVGFIAIFTFYFLLVNKPSNNDSKHHNHHSIHSYDVRFPIIHHHSTNSIQCKSTHLHTHVSINLDLPYHPLPSSHAQAHPNCTTSEKISRELPYHTDSLHTWPPSLISILGNMLPKIPYQNDRPCAAQKVSTSLPHFPRQPV
ncbi:hypothetical protein BU24DRAFT_57483 [Aaosphaeria arxii CBS 175.79]|uniref:Uncharacterized protein n=1 Tax=Aaosphaeria arxii CBS 175.79 TaxID=1450172 RepID=A0A6A5XBT0_9PLEO|nr:uncharacterized protein BU24DRAFT_57483 [Aaosphaeria arxii CBS 175.79]KAF2010381.1 hypothetical protein BU24DRAFT_57483 [Aaosphaeria arxii CBS 175.79]